MKRNYCSIIRILAGAGICLFSLFCLSNVSLGQSTLPPNINKIFFESSKFKQPIWLELPIGRSKSQFENLPFTSDIYESGIPSVRAEIGSGVEDCDKSLLSYLISKNFATVATKIQTIHNDRYGNTTKLYHFIIYTDEFYKNIVYSNIKDMYGNLVTKPYIILAHRQLISIDYKNQYDDAPLGMKRTFYSIVFTYKLVGDIPGFQIVDTQFRGKGKIYLNPDDGIWTLDEQSDFSWFKLSDIGANEYLNPIHNNYKPYIFESNVETYTNISSINTNPSDETINSSNSNSISTLVLDSHKGHFYNEISGLEFSRLVVNANSKYSSKQKMHYRSPKNEIVKYALFGKMDIDKDDNWVYKSGDTLSLKVDVDGIDFLKVTGGRIGKYHTTGDFILLTQIEDGDGNEYYKNSDGIKIDKMEKSVLAAFTIDMPIKIPPKNLEIKNSSHDFYLSFLLLKKEDRNPIVEGYVKYIVE